MGPVASDAGARSAAQGDPLSALLDDRGVVVLDGGLATQLEAQGNSLADPLWSARLLLEDPAEIMRAHLAFYRSGAAVATTVSYQATFEGFASRGIGHADAVDLLRRSVALASEARAAWQAERPAGNDRPLLVAASIGPYGAMLANGAEYRGRYGRSVAQLRAFHRERLEALAATEADVLACETIPELEEGTALVELLAETAGLALDVRCDLLHLIVEAAAAFGLRHVIGERLLQGGESRCDTGAPAFGLDDGG